MLNGHEIRHKSVKIDTDNFTWLVSKKIIYILWCSCYNTHVILIDWGLNYTWSFMKKTFSELLYCREFLFFDFFHRFVKVFENLIDINIEKRNLFVIKQEQVVKQHTSFHLFIPYNLNLRNFLNKPNLRSYIFFKLLRSTKSFGEIHPFVIFLFYIFFNDFLNISSCLLQI